ncbi:bifunctional 23S rRNA (guanine(2069)-N(7))-methyltransferase RlmK/23S rRNA (guanine(2445)-N(2))-methyltransferase RlmL [bacterium]|nr:bifunctional 23S rRNA (guanine(2069)-N(7))-methyltransferase RlmK/23S rRNA (guanine(2445)-N(2))-methyltransferase RlmL [bacterium]
MMDVLDTLFVTSPPEMGKLLAEELEGIGVPVEHVMRGGVYVAKSVEMGYRVCLWSRVANRVLWPLAVFSAGDEGALYEGVKTIPWEDHLDQQGTLAVDANCVQSTITHSHFTALKTKDAIVDRIRELAGERPSVDVQDPDLQINTYVFRNEARISIDLAGQSLYRRGYRTVGLEAPLKETLAAGLLYRAGWPAMAEAGGALVDPMCGTGTFLVEAAMMACKAAPGLLRGEGGSVRWRQHDADVWRQLVEDARQIRVRGSRDVVFGWDHDARAVRAAEQHAKQAGVDGLIRIDERAVRDLTPPQGLDVGLLITNPPYGQRLGEERTLAGLHRTLGARLRGYWPGWTAAVFTGNAPLCRELRLKPRRTYDYRNGAIPCRFAIYKLATSDRVKVQASAEPGVEMLKNRFRRNLRHVGKWARRKGISCFRVYDGDLPEYAFAVDLYTNTEGQQTAHVMLSESSDESLLTEARQASGVKALGEVVGLAGQDIVIKTRRRQAGDQQYGRLEKAEAFQTVEEEDAQFLVNLRDFHDTGLFLDNRFVRAYIQERSAGCRFLNLFGYTGTVTVRAALGGADYSTTIDLSNTYAEWARQNFEQNGLDASHEIVRTDCLEWLREAGKRVQGSDRYDLIYFDPPTFSNSKAMTETFDVQRDHVEWLNRALSALDDGGRLVFRCNRKGFRMAFEEEGFEVKDISRLTLAMDFERRMGSHHVFEIEERR